MLRVGIVGATGYVGLELVRLLHGHSGAEIAHLVSKSYEGEQIQNIYPSLKGCINSTLEEVNYAKLAKQCDVVFTALPHGTAAQAVAQLHEGGCVVIDLSADFRYDDPAVYKAWYGVEHTQQGLLDQAVYGLPEIHREAIKTADIIGNPGCYTTSAILALYPLLKAKVVSSRGLIIDAKSGVSGAGAKPSATVHFCEVDENLKAYALTTHRHTSEIEQELGHALGEEVLLSFSPHLLPIKRGIFSTIYADLLPGMTAQDALAAYQTSYGDEPFVTIYDEGSLPEIKHVAGSNRCAIGCMQDARIPRLVIVSCIDNLIKGAAGQAIQNMNLRMGLDETTGLLAPAWYL